ncbi:hypothetical protein AB0F91_34170 [Amycolatopsis sp. NPDC023774]|uniref:hypothetical protein n=1 Tax=Amycolatopsis sp. NPDC023774 TaxID=3155015 RepID=UPI0033D6FADD
MRGAAGASRSQWPRRTCALAASPPWSDPVAGAGLDITSPEPALAIVVAVSPVLAVFLFSQKE